MLSRWAALAQELIEAADALFAGTDLGDESNPLHTVGLSALTVMCRTANQFAAFRLLMENGFIVEARTMTRCCYENLFWLGGLKEKGTEFLRQMDAAHTQSTAPWAVTCSSGGSPRRASRIRAKSWKRSLKD